MAPMKLSISFIAVLIAVFDGVGGFVGPVPVGTRTRVVRRAMATNGLQSTTRVQARSLPRTLESSRRQASMSAAPDKMPSPGISGEEGAPRKGGRFSRISGRVRKIIRRAVMGYLPEEEVSYKQRAEEQAAAAAKLRGEPEIADERLRDASVAAKAAAMEAVEQSFVQGSFTGDEGEEDDWLANSDFVQLNIGDESPMEIEDKLASLRNRLEQGLPPDTAQEQAEKRRRAMEQQIRRQSSSRPPSFDGDTAVAERPSSNLDARQANEGGMRPQAPKEAPKMASAEDVERLNRMFGSMGGEPLR
ncbi:unnamed protein product [Ectocarpus sp. 4 AP-2014]